MPLKIDYKLARLFKEIQAELLAEDGIEYSIDTIERIVNQQIQSGIKGMAEGNTIVWKYFGTLVATQKRVEMLNRTYLKKGKIPTLMDTGLVRVVSFRDGTLNTQNEFYATGKRDMIPKFIKDERNSQP